VTVDIADELRRRLPSAITCPFLWRSSWIGQVAEGDRHSHDRFCLLNTTKQVGGPDHIKVFATAGAAATWFEENDPEGVAFEYEVLE